MVVVVVVGLYLGSHGEAHSSLKRENPGTIVSGPAAPTGSTLVNADVA